MPKTLIPFGRTTVLKAPSPAASGTTLIIPKITTPTVNPSALPWPETCMASVGPPKEAWNQENAEMLEVTKITEVEFEAAKCWELTVVRKAESTKAREVKVSDVFAFSIGATDLEPGPWVNCKLGPKLKENAEMIAAAAPDLVPQVRWEQRNERIGMRGNIVTNTEEIKKKSDVVIEFPENFIYIAASNYWLQVRVPVYVTAYINGKAEAEVVPIWTSLEMVTRPSVKYACQVGIPSGAAYELIFSGVSFFPYQ